MNEEEIEKRWNENLSLMKEIDPETINNINEVHLEIWKKMYKLWFEDGMVYMSVETNKINYELSLNTNKKKIRI